MASRYYQEFSKRADRWIKIDSYTELIVAVAKDNCTFENVPTEKPKKIKIKSFWDYFG